LEWIVPDKEALSEGERIRQALELLKGTRIMVPIEFGRAVHAEMSAFMDAARRGISVRGATLIQLRFLATIVRVTSLQLVSYACCTSNHTQRVWVMNCTEILLVLIQHVKRAECFSSLL
jgi:hypothetical protein